MAKNRLTRDQQKALTRSLLLESAERVFRRRGFHGTSLDEVAEEAGFSKGAVYSNFTSKNDLFLAFAEDRIAQRVLTIYDQVSGEVDLKEQALDAGRQFVEFVQGEPDWALLFLEFATHAARDPELRETYATHHRRLRDAIARLIAERAAAAGVPLPLDPHQLAALLLAVGNGMLIEKMVDPDGISDDLFGNFLAMLFASATAGQGGSERTPA